MSILFLTLGILPFLLPLWTQATFRQVWEYEARQIRLDNAAIELGRKDRELFRSLSLQVRALEGLEKVHHGVHACARSGTPAAAACLAQDAALEAEITLAAAAIEARARMTWAASARAPVGGQVSRPFSPPLAREICPVCGLKARFVSREAGRKTEFHWSGRNFLPVSVSVTLEGKGFDNAHNWEYRLEAE